MTLQQLKDKLEELEQKALSKGARPNEIYVYEYEIELIIDVDPDSRNGYTISIEKPKNSLKRW